MLNIAIIEDQPVYSRELIHAIRTCTYYEKIEINCFTSGESFCASDWQSASYGAVFIDIELGEMNGLEAAQILRQKGYRNMIVFTTNYEQFVYDGYEIEAFRYLLKPVKQEDIQACMERLEKTARGNTLVFSFKRKKHCIPYHDILYISSCGHYLTIHTKEQDYEWKYLLKNLQPELPNQFVRCHRSFVVNLDYMRKLDGKRIFLKNGEEIVVAAGYLDSVRKAISSMV